MPQPGQSAVVRDGGSEHQPRTPEEIPCGPPSDEQIATVQMLAVEGTLGPSVTAIGLVQLGTDAPIEMCDYCLRRVDDWDPRPERTVAPVVVLGPVQRRSFVEGPHPAHDVQAGPHV